LANVCIICEKEKNGEPVAEDAVLKYIRLAKQKLNMAKNNRLVVCSECMEAHKKKRAEFEKILVQHAAIAALVVIAFLALAFMGKGFSLVTVLLAFLVAGFILALSLARYWPGLEKGDEGVLSKFAHKTKKAEKKPAEKKEEKKTAKRKKR